MEQTPIDIHVREARSNDTDRVSVICEAAFAPLRSIYRPTDAAIARQTEQSHTGTRLVAEVGGTLAATVEYDQHPAHLHVIGLAVHPDFQQQGIARRLLDEISRRAVLLKQTAVTLNTIKETGNVPLFEKLGFQVTCEEVATWCVSDENQPLHDIRMERSVPPEQ